MSRDICICVTGGSDLSAPFDPRFGRAPAFLLTDASGADLEILPNPAAEATGGAGTRAAALMDERGVRHVVAGHFGPKAERGLRALGATLWLAPEGLDAGQVLARFRDGALERQAEATP